MDKPGSEARYALRYAAGSAFRLMRIQNTECLLGTVTNFLS